MELWADGVSRQIIAIGLPTAVMSRFNTGCDEAVGVFSSVMCVS